MFGVLLFELDSKLVLFIIMAFCFLFFFSWCFFLVVFLLCWLQVGSCVLLLMMMILGGVFSR